MICLAVLVNSNPLSAETVQTATIKWHVPSENLKTIREELKPEQAQIMADPNSVDADKGLPLVYIVSAVVLLPQLAKALVDVYKDINYGQVIISQDAGGKITIQHDPKASNDTLVFIDAQGKPTFHTDIRTLDANGLLEKLIAATTAH